MAFPIKAIYVDGVLLNDLKGFELEINNANLVDNSYVKEPYLPSNVKATVESKHGKMTFIIEGKEQIGNELHFYGPLRNMFPSLFKDRDLFTWQIAYLAYLHRPSLDRFKLTRADGLFTTELAVAFREGYFAGTKEG